jgi:HAD superfamily hydrolase (TIGR01509 family)
MDIDGTLVDSNFLHVEAWAQAFDELRIDVPSWLIQRAIGADSAVLLNQLIGDEPDDHKDRAKTLHARYYQALVPRLKLLPGARELITDLSTNGVRVVLATSAPDDELEALLTVLHIQEHIYAVTSAEDVEEAKPRPGIIAVALRKGDVDAAQAVMIGDSVWDIAAAENAGVAAIGVLSGGTGEGDLTRAGAIAVYRDAADLRQHLRDSPIGISAAIPLPERSQD